MRISMECKQAIGIVLVVLVGYIGILFVTSEPDVTKEMVTRHESLQVYVPLSGPAHEQAVRDVTIENHLQLARESLKMAQDVCVNRIVVGELDLMNDHLIKARKNLFDIGTSAEEVERLNDEGLLSQARLYLNTAREQCSLRSVEMQINGIRNLLATSKKTMVDLGIDEDDLDALLLQGYAAEIAALQKTLVDQDESQQEETMKKMVAYIQKSAQIMILE